MKTNQHEYLLILIKTVEMNEKSRIIQRGVLTNLIISQLLSVIECQTCFQINALTI